MSEIVEKVVDTVVGNMSYGHTKYKSGKVIPWMQIIAPSERKLKPAWDELQEKWVSIEDGKVLEKRRVFDKFVDDPDAKHGYRATYKCVMMVTDPNFEEKRKNG